MHNLLYDMYTYRITNFLYSDTFFVQWYMFLSETDPYCKLSDTYIILIGTLLSNKKFSQKTSDLNSRRTRFSGQIVSMLFYDRVLFNMGRTKRYPCLTGLLTKGNSATKKN